ncbi:LOW QUALITY PROTEIN: hypothetical protein V2J09_005715 [Rumex salicifolius]
MQPPPPSPSAGTPLAASSPVQDPQTSPLPPPVLDPTPNPPLNTSLPRPTAPQVRQYSTIIRDKKVGPKPIPLHFVLGINNGIINFTKANVADLVDKWNLTLVGTPAGEDLVSILEQGPWMLGGQRPFILRRCHEGMELNLSCLTFVPIWITLPNLDVRFWSEHMLARIGYAIGTPILTDFNSAHQQKLSFARVMVEINAQTKLLSEIQLHGEDQELLYNLNNPENSQDVSHQPNTIDAPSQPPETQHIPVIPTSKTHKTQLVPLKLNDTQLSTQTITPSPFSKSLSPLLYPLLQHKTPLPWRQFQIISLNIISWNIKGFNNPNKRASLLNLSSNSKADIISIIETHLMAPTIHTLTSTLFLGWLQYSNVHHGTNCRIWLWWNLTKLNLTPLYTSD